MNRKLPSIGLFVFIMLAAVTSHATRGKEMEAGFKPENKARVSEQYGKLPLLFEANAGQTDQQVKYLSRSGGVALFLTANEAVMRFSKDQATLAMRLVGAAPAPRVVGLAPTETRTNYFLGNDPAKWRTGVETFARVKYEAVYPGIDLVWHGDQRQLEHDFVVAPAADPRRIKFAITGAKGIKIDKDGSLSFKLESGEAQFQKPVAWQEAEGKRSLVNCRFVVDRRGRVGFEIGRYDRRAPLVIDPVLVYSTYLGGSASEYSVGVAIDKDRNAYLVGATFGSFPYTKPTPPLSNGTDVFILKLNSAGNAIVYATWIGGALEELPSGIAVDVDGNAYVTGYTFSQNFPTTAGALQSTPNKSSEGFVAKLNPAGADLVYSTYLGGGGSDVPAGIAVDKTGSAVVVGSTDSFDLLSTRNMTGIQSTRKGSLIYKSTDRGGRWASAASGLQGSLVSAIASDPKNPNVLYAITDNGIHKSIDSGGAWVKLSDVPFSGSVEAMIVIDPVNSSTVYAAAQRQVYKSTDGGQVWTSQVSSGGPPFNGLIKTLAINPATPSILYAGTSAGAYKSLDGSLTWAPINGGLVQSPGNPAPLIVRKLVISPANPLTLYAGTSSGVFVTTNAGGNWSRMENGIGQGEIRGLAIDPSAPNTIYAAAAINQGVYKTTDGGAIWNASNAGLLYPTLPITPPLLALEIDPAATSTIYVLTSNSGIYKTTDGAANWAPANTGIVNTALRAIALDPINSENVYTGATIGSDGFAARINPTGTELSWMTYLGGSEVDEARAVALDPQGNAYITGYTSSKDFSGVNPLPMSSVNNDVFVLKINAPGTAFGYGLIFGGGGVDVAEGIAVTSAGQAVVVGPTTSSNYPTVLPLKPALGGVNDAFITVVNSAGTALEFSTYFGGSRSEIAYGVAIDGAGDLYLTGLTSSEDFPLKDAVQTSLRGTQESDVFIAKIRLNEPTLIYSTYLGGAGSEEGRGIAVDSAGNVYVVGTTYSADFPVVGPYQALRRGSSDLFIAHLAGAQTAAAASAASFRAAVVAPESIASIFGLGFSSGTEAASTTPLPTSLQGVSVSMGPNLDLEPAPLFFVSPNQINLLVPAALTPGDSVLLVSRSANGGVAPSSGVIRIENVVPGLFSVDSTGQGLGTGVVLRVKADSSQVYEPIVQFDAVQNKLVPIPIDLGPDSEQVFVVLYGTGFRRRSALDRVSVNLGGENAVVSFAGAQGFLVGLDQVNALLPRTLIGRGEVDVVMTVDGAAANTVKLVIK